MKKLYMLFIICLAACSSAKHELNKQYRVVKVRKVIVLKNREVPVTGWEKIYLKDVPTLEHHGDTMLQVKLR